MKKLHLSLLTALVLCGGLFAQQSIQPLEQSEAFRQALRLYRQGDYAQAQSLFRQIQAQSPDASLQGEAHYYAASSAIRLRERQADKELLGFVEKYPLSPKRWAAYREVGDYYYNIGRYLYALKWYRQVKPEFLSPKAQERFHFRFGYCLYAAGKREEAKAYLSKAKETEEYASQAAYYLGFISYEEDDYQGANEEFSAVQDPQLLEEKLDYFQADMNFKLGKFEEAIAQAKAYMPRADREETSELNKLIGESYFQLEQYAEALPFLEKFEGRKGKWSNEDYYQLGYCHYQKGDFNAAIESFNRIIESPDALGQNAYYHLGQAYLQADKKTEALNAFRQASSMDFDGALRREAFLNYAQLGYQIGNAYEPATTVLQRYLTEYPRDENQRALQKLLLDAYVSSQNFEEALRYLEDNKEELDKESRQKIYFFRGLQLFAEGDYLTAQSLLSSAIEETNISVWTARSLYWSGEAAARQEDHNEALTRFLAFETHEWAQQCPEYTEKDYQLGYAHFQLGQYPEAAGRFSKAKSDFSGEDPRRADAQVREADALFASSQFSQALAAYRELPGGHPELDYALFQQAKAEGLLGRPAQKIRQLAQIERLYPNSTYRDDALFERASALAEQGQEAEALQEYQKLLQAFPESSLYLSARLREILILYNQGQLDASLERINALVKDYPESAEATQAVSTAKLIYMDKGEVSKFAAWVRDLRFVQLTDTELEEASYSAAQSLIDQGKTAEAISACEDYLKAFPLGARAGYLSFQLGEIYFGMGQKEQALGPYKRAADASSTFSEKALTRVANYYVEQNQLSTALPYLERLLARAEVTENKRFALSNLMKVYFEQGQFDRCIAYSEELLASPGLSQRLSEDAWLFQARSAWVSGQEGQAQKAYTEVLKTATASRGAEALYYKALFQNKDEAFEASNQSIEALARSYAGYQEWGARGLILMARNYDALGDPFQATYILESVIENFAELLPQKLEAEGLLQQIKAKAAQNNSSLTPQNNRP